MLTSNLKSEKRFKYIKSIKDLYKILGNNKDYHFYLDEIFADDPFVKKDFIFNNTKFEDVQQYGFLVLLDSDFSYRIPNDFKVLNTHGDTNEELTKQLRTTLAKRENGKKYLKDLRDYLILSEVDNKELSAYYRMLDIKTPEELYSDTNKQKEAEKNN